MYFSATYVSPVGTITLASNDGEHLAGLWVEGQKYFGGTVSGDKTPRDDLSVFSAAKAWLDRYFAGDRPDSAELALRPAGTPFRREVWRILCRIPYGEILTYGGVAEKVAVSMGKKSMSSQAVGGAVAHNPISIIIPCHRVVGANGSLTGYAGGMERKIRLLELEGVDMSGLFVPAKGTAL